MSTSTFKVAIVGSGSVGKSCLVLRFINDKFVAKYNPTIQDEYHKDVIVDGCAVRLEILDTAGQDEFSQLRDTFLKEGRGIIIVYAIDSATSFDDVDQIHEQVLRIKEGSPQKPILTLAGNKCDLEDNREVTSAQGKEKADSWSCPFIETSALSGTGVTELFEGIAARLVRSEPKKKSKKCNIL